MILSLVDRELEDLESTREATLLRLGSVSEEPLVRCAELDLGDEVRCPSGAVTVEVRCPGGSRMVLSERFRVSVVPPEDGQDCKVDLRSGATEAASDRGTGVQGGPVAAGALRTQYEVRVDRRADGATQTVTVFDGEVAVRALGGAEALTVSAGAKVLHQGREWDHRRLDQSDVLRVAQISARLAAAKAPTKSRSDAGTVYRELIGLYQKTLTRPDDAGARLELADAQLSYQLPTEALFQLQKAESMEPAEPELKARIPLAQSKAYEQLGQNDKAQVYMRKAVEIDSDALGVERVRPESREPQRDTTLRPQPDTSRVMAVAARELRVRASVRVGRGGALVTVRVTGSDGDPVPEATVEVRAPGGTFPESGGTRVRGTTDQNGTYEAKWTCSRCAPAYTLRVIVSRTGYEDATA
ncbi:MAG TPA: hypothetical protein VLF66_09855, partial [Thermoanaerobaculia bacterium]|nr:hypothetical protein [Thermoanaerobaculia bacterium]